MKRRMAFAAGMTLCVTMTMSSAVLRADENEQDPTLPDGCDAHLRPVEGGYVDWAEGFIIARGLGKGQGRSARQMAKRGAELVALRYFAGLRMSEAAAVLGVSMATAERFWTFAKSWLFAELSDHPE